MTEIPQIPDPLPQIPDPLPDDPSELRELLDRLAAANPLILADAVLVSDTIAAINQKLHVRPD